MNNPFSNRHPETSWVLQAQTLRTASALRLGNRWWHLSKDSFQKDSTEAMHLPRTAGVNKLSSFVPKNLFGDMCHNYSNTLPEHWKNLYKEKV